MISSLGQRLGLDRAALAHGLRLALAAWLAYAIASLLHVGNAYWAAMPIWVVSQSAKGLLIERGVFRIGGTLLGAAAGFGILWLGLTPYASLAVLGLWVAANASLVHLLRGVHGYGALMSGMTAAVVVLPSILHPDHAAAVAMARVECTLIGVVVVTLVTGFWTPSASRRDFYARVRRLARDAIALALSFPVDEADARESAILQEMADLQADASLVAAGSIEGYRRLHHVDALIVAALALMAAGRTLSVRLNRKGLPPGVLDEADARDLAARLLATSPENRQERETQLSGIGRADASVLDALDRIVLADRAFDAEPGSADARSFRRKATYLAPHRDGRIALETGLFTGAATFGAGALGYASGWSMGELAALGICIFSMVLGSLPDPKTVAPVMLRGVVLGVAAALLYRLTVQPSITTVPQLVLSVAPFMLAGGLARASRKAAGPALDANMCFMLASQAVLPAVTDRVVIFNEAAALLLSVSVVTSGFMLLPPAGERRALRAARAIGADLMRILQGSDTAAALRRPVLRLSLHIEKSAHLGTRPGWSLLAALNLGEAIGRLRRRLGEPKGDRAARRVLEEALADLKAMIERPGATADRLESHARTLADAEAAEILLDTANALRASRLLLAHAGGGSSLSPSS